ncbi:MAG: hypothetical protein HYW65_01190 [Candidatus Liptonbacteria bacterium]|nr:hypothetical protein [Candidatus Liptonbacteria bacterium]
MLKKAVGALSRKERLIFFLALLSGVISTAALAAVKLERATTAVPAHGGDYTEGMVGQPAYVNPVLAATETDMGLVRLVFSNIPAIAEKAEVSDDRRVWNIRIKERLVWHDGAKLTSDDVLFTIQKIQDPESRSPLALSWQGITARRVSELELNLYLPSPYAFFDDNLKNLFILPKHLFADIPPSNWRLSERNLKPIGSGPYRFDSYAQQPDGFIETYRLRASSPPPPAGRISGVSGGAPNIAVFGMDFFRNSGSMLKAFNAGRIDGVAGADAAFLSGIRRPYTLSAFTTPSYYAAFFNPSHNAALQDSTVRAVLAQAVDRSTLITRALGGYGAPQEGPLPGESVSSSAPAPSLAALADMLDAAGWNTSTSTNARVKFQGKSSTTLEATLIVPDMPFLAATAEALRDAWAPLGMKVTLAPAHPEDILDSVIKNRDYDILLFGNVLNPPEDLFSFWHSSQRFFPGLNIALLNSKKVDALTEKIREGADADAREKDLHALDALIRAEVPAAFLYSPQYLFVTAKNVGGIEPRSIEHPAERFANVAAWYVKTARVLK